MTLYRSRYGATSAANYDDPNGEQHHWPDASTVLDVGPRTAALLAGHELFSEVAPHEHVASASPAPHASSPTIPGTPTTLDEEPAVAHEVAPEPVTEKVTEPSPVTATEDVDDEPAETGRSRSTAARRRRRVTE